MRRIAAAAVALIAAAVPAFPASPQPAPPPLEVMYVPQQDINRVPGYGSEGVFLPLSRILLLAETAGREAGKPPGETGVYCRRLVLRGNVGDAVNLEGEIEFEAPGSGWSATLVDDGAIPWTSQDVTTGTAAFLARVDGKTYLFADAGGTTGSAAARGDAGARRKPGEPLRGTIRVKALLPFLSSGPESTINLGNVYAPCRLDLELAAHLKFLSATVPAREEAPGRLSLWLSAGSGAQLWLRSDVPLTAASSLRATVLRTVSVRGAGIEVADQLVFEDRFVPGALLDLRLPAGMKFLRASSPGGRVSVEATTGVLVVKPLEDAARITLDVVFAAELRDGKAMLGQWSPDAVSRKGELRLVSSGDFRVLPVAMPASLQAVGGDASSRVYEFWGEMPSVEVALVPAAAPLPLAAMSWLDIAPSEATLRCQVQFKDREREELVFDVPEGWLLTDLEARGDSGPLPCSLQQLSGLRWRASWQQGAKPAQALMTVHRVGAWGSPGTTATLAVPVIGFAGEVPAPFEFVLSWPEALEVAAPDLAGMAIVPVGELENTGLAVPMAKLALRSVGSDSSARVRVRGRDTDVRATVVTVLSLDEERATARSFVTYDVRFAPTNTFKVAIPRGVGKNVRIDGEGIRETSLRATPEADEWTIVTQESVQRSFAVTLEWQLAGKPTAGAIAAPEIRIPGVSSQRGFLVLEASETLNLVSEVHNLQEADLAELPSVPWQREQRVLGVYRYVEPPYSLNVKAERFVPEPALEGLVRELQITTTVAPNGERFTRAAYTLIPTSDRQFFEFQLPDGAELWSVLVNDRGEKPARRKGKDGLTVLLVPLPAAAGGADVDVRLLYREARKSAFSTQLALLAPAVTLPVNRTVWSVNLPPRFEYLSYGGTLVPRNYVREPVVTFLRTAYYPERLVFPGASVMRIAVITVIAFFVVAVRHAFVLRRERKLSFALEAEGIPEEEPTPPRRRAGCGMLIELLIVVVIIAILAAIAVPNFLEAQVRSKVSRVKSDARSLATAIEAYMVDNNQYPMSAEILWQGPIKYAGVAFTDPYAETPNTPLKYDSAQSAYQRVARGGLVPPGEGNSNFWMVWSIGPDQVDNGGELIYDPTNGTVSTGDIVRFSDSLSSFQATYTDKRAEEAKSVRFHVSDGPFVYDPTNGTVSPGDVWRVKQGGPAPPPGLAGVAGTTPATTPAPAEGKEGEVPGRRDDASKLRAFRDISIRQPEKPATAAPALLAEPAAQAAEGTKLQDKAGATRSISNIPDVIIGDAEDNVGRDNNFFVFANPFAFDAAVGDVDGEGVAEGQRWFGVNGGKAVSRRAAAHAGLLSLGIEIPEGGVQRQFEALGAEGRIEVRFLDVDAWKRLRFVAWFGAFLALALAWWRSPRAYRILLAVVAGVSLLLPVVVSNPWAGIYNAVFQGALMSLAVPLVAHVLRLFHRNPVPHAAAAMLLALLTLSAPSARAEQAAPPQGGEDASTAVRAVVPYGDNEAPETMRDPLAFIARGDFTRLWDAAQRDAGASLRAEPAILGVAADGSLVPEESRVRGTLGLGAVNPLDHAVTVPLNLHGLAISSVKAVPAGANLEAAYPDGGKPAGEWILLRMDAHWAGSLSADFELPCEVRGNSGKLRMGFPDAASGIWRITVPYGDAEGITSGKPAITRRTADATTFLGAAGRGELALEWSGRAGAATVAAGATAWRAAIRTEAVWDSLASAKWETAADIEPAAGGILPEEVSFVLDPGLRIHGARGDKLLACDVSPGSVKLRLARGASANVVLEGTVLAPDTVATTSGRAVQSWQVPGIRVPRGVEAHTELTLVVSDKIEIVAADSRGALRKATRGARPGYATQVYAADAGDWAAQLQLRRLQPALKVEAAELFAPGDGMVKRAARVRLSPRGGVLHECVIGLAPGERVLSAGGDSLSGWAQRDGSLVAFFSPPVESATLTLVAAARLTTSTGALVCVPLAVPAAEEIKGNAAVLVPVDMDLSERDLAGASPRPPGETDGELSRLLQGGGGVRPAVTRAYKLASREPLRFDLAPADTRSVVTAFNHLVLAEGLVTLETTVTAEPKRGRIHEVEALLVLPAPDARVAERLEAVGPVRNKRVELVSPTVLRVVAELLEPSPVPVSVQLRIDWPANTDGSKPVGLPVVLPSGGVGARAFALVRRALEGELAVETAAGARPVDAGELRDAKAPLEPLPSDLSLELAVAAPASPAVRITRHARVEALRAIVEVLRQRTTLTADGFERHELEMVLQNQSEQFLKVALPYPKSRISVYEAQVASRPVKAAFGSEGGREVLLIPLIRTGLLDPGLTVRVACTVRGGEPMSGKGVREQRMPEILGGVPVAQSALSLYLPSQFSYSKFEGTMNPAGALDLEVDEQLRRAKQAQKMSEAVLYSRGDVQLKALSKLAALNEELSFGIKSAKQQVDLKQKRGLAPAKGVAKDELAREQELDRERYANIDKAERAQQAIASNTAALGRIVGQQQVQQQQQAVPVQQAAPPQAGSVPQQQVPPVVQAPQAAGVPQAVQAPQQPGVAVAEQAVEPPPPPVRTIGFPHVGDVFVFRQLQGTGKMSFRYASRELAGHRNDVLLALVLAAVLAGVLGGGARLFGTRQRIAGAVLIVALVAILFKVALDLTIPIAAIALYVLAKRPRREAAQAPEA